jgi:hypothetical protein
VFECGVCNGPGYPSGACNCDGSGLDVDNDGDCDNLDEDGDGEIDDDCVGDNYDECGVCNGIGIADGACDCGGNDFDCLGVCGGDAIQDKCDICDNDASNDDTTCIQDCEGTWGGPATTDNCGICDDDTSNNDTVCIQDCEGTWGGTATIDNCGICDDDDSNDDITCTQDCEGTWNGFAIIDECDECVGGNTGLEACEQDCNGVWGGDVGDEDTDGATIDGVEDGDAIASGFTVSGNGNIVLGFSFTASTIPAGCGVLTNLTLVGEATGLSEFVFSDPTGAQFDIEYNEPVGTELTACDLPINNVHLSDNGDVWYNVDTAIGGFQFSVDGATISGVSGGDAESYGFTVSSSQTTVLGFSFTGGTIPAGCGVLTVLELDGEAAGLSGIIVSDSSGNSLDFTYYDDSGDDGGDGGSCDDEDGDGVCDDVDDCVGEYDECDVCNGSGIPDGLCDCDGNSEDCTGECGGTAAEDECGICNGDGITEGECNCDGNIEDCAGDCGGSAEFDEESDTIMPLSPAASPSSSSTVSTPHPAGIVPPVKEKPKTVVWLDETVKPYDSASPPETPLIVAPSTLN